MICAMQNLRQHITTQARVWLPWLFTIIPLMIGLSSLTGHEFARPFLLFPSLLALSLVLIPLVKRPTTRLPALPLLGMGMYLCVILASTLLLYPQIISPAFINAFVMLVLPGALICAGWLHPELLRTNTKLLILALSLTELAIVGQIWVSYYTGLGEVMQLDDGIRRAYGSGGDAFTVVIVFFVFLNAARKNYLRMMAAITALFMSAAKMGIVLSVLGMLLLLFFLASRKHKALALAMLGIAIMAGIALTSQTTRSYTDPLFLLTSNNNLAKNPPIEHVVKTPQSNPLPANHLAPPPSHLHTGQPHPPDLPITRREQRSLLKHMLIGLRGTGTGRLISIGAAWQMFSTHPLLGVGYGQANDPTVFREAVNADVLGLKDALQIPQSRLDAEKLVGNQTALVAAEHGLAGLIPFGLFCLTSCLMAFIILHRIRKIKGDSLSDFQSLALSSAIWVLLLVIGNQTAPWLLSASAMTIWLAFALGLCAAALQPELSEHDTAKTA